MAGVTSFIPIASMNSISSSFVDVLSTVVGGWTCWCFCIVALRLLLLLFPALEVILGFELFSVFFVAGAVSMCFWVDWGDASLVRTSPYFVLYVEILRWISLGKKSKPCLKHSLAGGSDKSHASHTILGLLLKWWQKAWIVGLYWMICCLFWLLWRIYVDKLSLVR